MKPLIKVCGLKSNAPAVIALQPDYIGFIFFKGSARYYEGLPPEVPSAIKKVGVFVNHSTAEVLEKLDQFGLAVIQLHGDESVGYCQELRSALTRQEHKETQIWKAFGVGPAFDFTRIEAYLKNIDGVLLDTKGALRGGNGVPFDWELLNRYTANKPIILSGGIGPESIAAIEQVLKSGLPLEIIDINSRFEIEPGFKNIQSIKIFIDELSS